MAPPAPEYRIEVIEEPASLDRGQLKQLTDAFIRLAWRSTGGDEWQAFVPAREGWERYFQMVGTRVQDYARIGLVYDGEELVHMSGLSLAPMGRDLLTWFRVTHTHPEHRRAGLLTRATIALFDDWPRQLRSRVNDLWLVFRTLNPVVYEVMRSLLLSGYVPAGVDSLRFYPIINDSGELEPLPDAIRDVAQRSMAVTSPDYTFDPETFVLQGVFSAQYHVPVFADVTFPCDTKGSQLYFDRHLDRVRQDGLVVLISFIFASDAA